MAAARITKGIKKIKNTDKLMSNNNDCKFGNSKGKRKKTQIACTHTHAHTHTHTYTHTHK